MCHMYTIIVTFDTYTVGITVQNYKYKYKASFNAELSSLRNRNVKQDAFSTHLNVSIPGNK